MTERICEWCNQPYYPKHGNQKYCQESCAKSGEKENVRLRQQNYRKRWGLRERKGTGYLGSTPQDEFYTEWLSIQREKQRLGLA